MSEVVSRTRREIVVQQRLSYVLVLLTIAFAVFSGKEFRQSQRDMALAQSQRADAEAKRDEALQRTALIIESSPWAMIVCNEDGTITDTNAAAEKMLGWSHGEMIGKQSEFLVVPEEFRSVHEKAIKDAAARLREYNGNWLLTSNRRAVKALTKDGQEIDAIATVRALKNAGKIEFILSLGNPKPPGEGPLKLQEPEKLSDVVEGIAKRNPEFSALMKQEAAD